METSKLSGKSFKRKILLWASQWSQEDVQEKEMRVTPDAMDIARLLQAAGYQLRTTERRPPGEISPSSGQPAGQVIITCPRSGLRMHMEASTKTCNCPLPEDGQKDSWQAEAAGDCLVPELDREISRAVGEILGKVLSLIDPLRDMNCKTNVHNSNNVPDNTSILQNESSAMEIDSPIKTPATGITIITPNAPNIPKKSQGNLPAIPNRYRSLDTLTSNAREGCHDLPEPGQLTPKNELMTEDSNHETAARAVDQSEKKLISRSSPVVSTNSLLRSDTFTCEDVVQDDRDESKSETPPKCTPSPVPPSSSRFLQLLCDTQLMISDVIFALAGNKTLLKQMSSACEHSAALGGTYQKTAEDTRPIRRLSMYGNIAALTRPMTTVNPNPQPKVRRSATSLTVPVTPTSSRGTAATSSSKRPKSASTTALQTAGLSSKISKLSLPSGSRIGQIFSTRSRQSLGPGVPCTSRSPQSFSPGTESAPMTRRSMGNLKYSHVQSTIPKPTNLRKRQE